MKKICIVSVLFILLVSCTPVSTPPPTLQPGQLSLDIPSACSSMMQGLCIVSDPGEILGGGQPIVINQTPTAAFIGNSTALQIKVGDWTLVFDPGQNTPFSVGMTFPNAKLYPQTSTPGMSIENNGKKCDQVDGEFTDDILQTAQNGTTQVNPVSNFDIRFSMHCNQEKQVLTGRVKLSQ
ncbi:MAG TPA: hypothetical protein VMT91_09380 [Anaerolineales bacterium]|nr:hypothetical protein [Anaerolineales bacterium]